MSSFWSRIFQQNWIQTTNGFFPNSSMYSEPIYYSEEETQISHQNRRHHVYLTLINLGDYTSTKIVVHRFTWTERFLRRILACTLFENVNTNIIARQMRTDPVNFLLKLRLNKNDRLAKSWRQTDTDPTTCPCVYGRVVSVFSGYVTAYVPAYSDRKP